jgi:Zn-dependent protease
MHLDLAGALLKVLLLWILTAPHEFAHAWVATRLGDDTPEKDGRVTLNPLAHVDWIGTALLPFIMALMGGGFIGWGRPVRTEPSKLKGGLNGLALVSLAGPASNIVMAVIMGGLGIALLRSSIEFSRFLFEGVQLSIYLAIFNMLPIPPLDGSKLLLAMRVPIRIYVELARFGFMLLIVLVSATDVGRWMSALSDMGTYAILVMFGWRG